MSTPYPYDSEDFSAEVKAFLGMLREWPLRECPDKDMTVFAESMPTAEFRSFIHSIAVHDVRYIYLGDLEIDETAVEWIRSSALSNSQEFNFAHGDFGRTYTASIRETHVDIRRWGDEDYPEEVDDFYGLQDLVLRLTADLEDKYLPDSYVSHLRNELEKQRVGLIFSDIETHEKIAREEENNGRAGFLPLGKDLAAPGIEKAEAYGDGAVLKKGAAAEVLFLPVNGYEEVRIIKKDGTEIEVPLPSKIAYRNMSDISPSGTRLAVASNVRARVVDLETGKCLLALEGPWMTGIACLAGEFMAVLTEGGDRKLSLADPDVRELSSLKTIDTAADDITIGCSAMVHVLDMKGSSKLLYSFNCTADAIQSVINGRMVILRRYPWREDVWGTAVLGFREGRFSVLAKYPRDIGRVFEKDGAIFGERGFQLVGFERALEETGMYRLESIDDTLEIDKPPLPRETEFFSRNRHIRFESVSIDSPSIPLPAGARTDLGLSSSDWIPDSSICRFFPVLRYSDGLYTVSLGMAEGENVTEKPLNTDIRTTLLVYRFSPDAELLLLSMAGGNYIVKTDTGKVERISEQLRNVESAEIIDSNTIAVLSRLDEENSQLDIRHRDDETEPWRVVLSIPTHALDSMRYLHDNHQILLSFKLMPRENSVILFLYLKENMSAVLIDTSDMTMEEAWSNGGNAYIKNREGAVYSYEVNGISSAAPVLSMKYELPSSGRKPSVITRGTGDNCHSYGYIDRNGKMVISPRWASAAAFSGRSAAVGLSPHGFCGLVSGADTIILPSHASWIGEPVEGYRRVAYASYPSSREPSDSLFGIAGPEGGWLVDPEYSFADDVHEKRAAIRFSTGDENWVTTGGARLSDDRFQNCGRFSEGLASAMKSGLNGYVDLSGDLVIDFRFNVALPFKNRLAGVKMNDNLWRCVDHSGVEVTGRKYNEFYSHMDGFAVVRSGENWGYVDASGCEPFGMKFQRTYNFISGLGVVIVAGRWNFITAEGRFVSEKGWDGTYLPSEGMGSYLINGLYGYVNSSGNTVTGPLFEGVYAYSEGLSAVNMEGKWGYIDKEGNWVIKPRFAEVRNFSEGLAPVREEEGSLWGYIDKSGSFAVMPRFREAYIFSNGLAVVGT